jgi:preprotein translocase subunit SecD|tara:strand:- start:366 stop:1973 length:1608 start_codon:yes stop_codon:yes gene_type:complete
MVYFAKWKMILVAIVCVFGLAFAFPNLLSDEEAAGMPGWLPSQKMNLGLDLQGGAHLLLEVDVKTVFQQRNESMIDSLRIGMRRATPRIGYRRLGVRGDCFGFDLRKEADQDRVRQVLRDLEPNSFDPLLEAENDGLSYRVCWTDNGRQEILGSTLDQLMEILRRRIDETGTKDLTIQRQGAERILVQVPGAKDTEGLKSRIGTEAKMTFHLLDRDNSAATVCLPGRRKPPGTLCLPSADETEADASGNRVMYLVKRRVMVDGANLVDAQGTFQDAQAVVSFRFDGVGARRFGDVTRKNVGQPFAIVLDKEVISAPVIREPILGGSGIISGNFTLHSAQELALLLRAGALPAPLTILEERTVGAELGADSIAAGKFASILSIILVIVFMAAAYGLFGFMANVALALNIILIAAVLSMLQATLTLPGIAGIVLTIGMAVDANVLIFERIREEERNGRTPISAVDSGYQRALTTIIDANLTTLIAAFLLYMFGSGPIKGFAVTLAIGLMTSMFTAIMVTRLMVVTWLHRRKPKKLPL